MSDGLDPYMANAASSSWDNYLYTGSDGQSLGDANCIRNTNCWLNDTGADLTGITARCGFGGWGAAVSPRHVLMANHVGVGIGTVLRWLDGSGNEVTRTVDQNTFINGSVDILLCRLDTALPVSITPLKLFPSNASGLYDPTIPGPIVALKQTGQVSVLDLTNLDNNAEWESPSSTYRYIHSSPIIGGDSGYAVMTVVHGNLVMLTSLYSPLSGPNYAYFSSDIQALVQADGEDIQFATVP